MKTFNRKTHRFYPMKNTVSYKRVPVPRGIAYALDLIDRKGGVDFTLNSVIRVDSILKTHNKQFGTKLSGQQYLYNNQWRPGFNPANPPSKTSHCWYSDGNPVYKQPDGDRAYAGQKIAWYQIGIDTNQSDAIINAGRRIGFDIVRPYKSGSEYHHIVFRSSPIPLLERWGTIAKHRAG